MKNIAVVPVIRRDEDIKYTKETVTAFLKNGASVWMDKIHKDKPYSCGAKFADADEVYKNAELITALGGDGTILRAAENALKYDVPILGINLGRLGYMAELEKDEIYLIDNIFNGRCSMEKRMALSAEIEAPGGSRRLLGDVLNDVVIGRGKYAHCIDIDLLADGKMVRTIRSDGLISATPTGSTAYSMAAGGSVLDPTLECICATPIVPTSRYACPIVFSGNSILCVVNNDERADEWSLVLDGEERDCLRCGEKLIISRSCKSVNMLSLKDEGFFETLNSKISKYELKK